MNQITRIRTDLAHHTLEKLVRKARQLYWEHVLDTPEDRLTDLTEAIWHAEAVLELPPELVTLQQWRRLLEDRMSVIREWRAF